jgi:hypothetical protein
VLFGTWNESTQTFFQRSGSDRSRANCIRVIARRLASRGQGVDLMFAPVVGQSNCDVIASSTAMITRVAEPSNYGFIGLDSVRLNGSVVVDSYNSGKPGPASPSQHGTIASNGDIQLINSVTVYGDARPGEGQTLSMDSDAYVTGSTAPLTETLDYPTPSAGSAAGVNNNGSIAGGFVVNGGRDLLIGNNKTLTLNAGTYYFRNVDLKGGGTLRVQGKVTLYVYGQLDLAGNAGKVGGRPEDFSINVTGSGDVNLGGTSSMIANLLAPASNVKISGTAFLHYDESLGAAGSAGLPDVRTVTLVQ